MDFLDAVFKAQPNSGPMVWSENSPPGSGEAPGQAAESCGLLAKLPALGAAAAAAFEDSMYLGRGARPRKL